MDLSECTKFANEHPACTVATVEGDQPRARIFQLWYADDSGFYFCSGTPKAVCQQLQKNRKAELCFYAPAEPPDLGQMMRVSGEVEFLQDHNLRTRLLEEWPFLKEMGITGPDDPNLATFRISNGQIKFWTSGPDMRENVEVVKF